MGTASPTELVLQAEVRQLRAHIADLERQLQLVEAPNGELPAPEKRTGVERPLGDREALEWHDSEDKRYRMLFETMLEGFCLIEVIFDSDGKPVDYRFLETNASFESQTGLKNAKGRLMRELAPDHEAHWFEIYGQIALTGQPARFANEAKALNRWYDVSAYRVGGPESRTVGIMFNDITAARQSEMALRESEQRLTAHMDNSPLAVIEFDPQFRVMRWSKGAERIFGWSSKEIVGRAISEVRWVFEEDAELVRQVSQDMLDGTRPRNVSANRNYCKDGSVVDCEWYNSAIYGIDGRLASIFSQILDVTDRKHAEEHLREAVERYERQVRLFDGVASTTPDFVYLFDRQGRFLFANRHLLEVWGMQLADAVGKTCRELGYEQWHHDMHMREIAQVIETKRPIKGEVPFKAPLTGIFGVYEYIFTPVLGPDGEVETIAGTTRDVTERKQAEEALRESQAKLQAALASMTDAVFISDAAGRFLHINDAFAAFHRFRTKEECGRTFAEYPEILDVFLPDGTVAPVDMWAVPRALRGETATNAEYTLRRRDTGETWVGSYSFGPIRDQSGAIAGSVVVARDITELKQAEETLRKSEAKLRAVFGALSEGIVFLNRQGEVEEANNAVWRIDGHKNLRDPEFDPRSHMIRPDGTAFSIDDQPAIVALRTGQSVRNVEMGVPTADGQISWRLVNAEPVYDEDRKLLGAVASFFDITERKRAEERLRQAQKLESVGLLAGGIAHDFNNLLTGIMGNASLVLEDVEPKAAERIKEVISSAERAANLTRQLLAYSGKGQFIIRDLDISEAVHEIAALVEFSIPKSVQLSVNVQRRLPIVRMDPSQLQQILMNLVINAGEAIGEGNPGNITVATSMADIVRPFVDAIAEEVAPGRYLCIEVSDTGHGIDEETKAKIFDPFFTTKFTGRGLGLAAVAGILRSHKGGITLDSAPGRGSTFRVFLPVAERYGQVAAEQAGSEVRGTILVVDDELSVRDFIGAVLRRQHYRVLLAADGREALAVCERERGNIDAAVLDVVMPVMGANNLVPALKSQRPEMRILLTSGYSEAEARRLCAAYPGAAFIQKPYTAQQIAKIVDEVLGVTRP